MEGCGEEIIWPKVILFGDSLTQHALEPDNGLWGALLADKLQRIADVVVRGFSGYNSEMCRAIMSKVFKEQDIGDVKAFVIFLGVNDACSEFKGYATGVSVADYKKNLAYIIDHLKSIGVTKDKVILITPPPYHLETSVSFCEEYGFPPPKRSNEITGEYANACVSVAKQRNVDVIDLYSEMMNEENWEKYLLDGVHLSCTGSRKLFSLLYPLIEKRVDTSVLLLPHWSKFVSLIQKD